MWQFLLFSQLIKNSLLNRCGIARWIRLIKLNRVAFTGVFRKRITWNYMPWEAYRRGLYASHSRNIGHCTVKYVNGVEIIVKTNVTSKRSKTLRSKRFETNLWVFVHHSIATLQYKLFHIKAFVFMRLILNVTSLYNRILDDNLLHNLISERSLADFPSLEYL